MMVGEISQKIDRGKHTTRHSELFSIGDNTYPDGYARIQFVVSYRF